MGGLLRPASIAATAILLVSLAGPIPAKADGTTITVNTVEDIDGARCATGFPCSLRMALSNASTISGEVSIEFDIPGPAPHVLRLEEPLLPILRGNLSIRGESDPDFVDRPVIVLDGSGLSDASGLILEGERITVRGLSLVGFTGLSGALSIQGDHNTVRNCMVGISPSGEAGGGPYGIRIWGEYNTLEANLISGNQTGVYVNGPYNTLTSNYIGVNFEGTRAVSGMRAGIELDIHGNYTQIGGPGSGDGNLISGATPWGSGILVGSAYENVIVGNKIGTDAAGGAAIPNYIGIDVGSITCTGGCPVPFNTRIEGNVISGNLTCGLDVGRFTTHVYGNYIGTDAAATRALPNGECGVRLSGDDVRLGGFSPGQENVVSGNPVGVEVHGSGNQVVNSRIGTSADGTTAIPNQVGIRVSGPGNVIGGDEAGHGNLISGNEIGLLIEADHTIVRDNRIGTDVTGTRSLPNGVGVRLAGYGEGDYVGGGDEAMGNVVAFNRTHGIELAMAGGVQVVGNLIHHNGGDGIRLSRGEAGAAGSASRNTFTLNSTFGNGSLGIHFEDAAFNRGIDPPVISTSERTYAAGQACANCRVEIFLSDMDPSGFGEGKTFLAWNNADADRSFRVSYPEVGGCKVLTATATDADGNTSEFSRNASIGICFRPPALVALIWILIAGGGGSALTIIIRRRPPDLRSLPWIALGGLVGLVLGYLLLRLPFVRVDWGLEDQAPPSGPAPGNLPAPVTLTPIVNFTLTPAPAPEAMARENANCRHGPSMQFNVATYLLQGQVVPITGRLAEGGWWQVQAPDLAAPCWISESVAELNGNLDAVPLVVPPALPTITPTEEPATGCRCWTGNVCQALPQCPAQCTPCP